jgi:hypothetical protein
MSIVRTEIKNGYIDTYYAGGLVIGYKLSTGEILVIDPTFKSLMS